MSVIEMIWQEFHRDGKGGDEENPSPGKVSAHGAYHSENGCNREGVDRCKQNHRQDGQGPREIGIEGDGLGDPEETRGNPDEGDQISVAEILFGFARF